MFDFISEEGVARPVEVLFELVKIALHGTSGVVGLDYLFVTELLSVECWSEWQSTCTASSQIVSHRSSSRSDYRGRSRSLSC